MENGQDKNNEDAGLVQNKSWFASPVMWAGAVGILLLTAAAVLFQKGSQPELNKTLVKEISPTAAAAGTALPLEVKYTDQGFSPQTLDVQAGQTVIFKNESRSDMWVASNPHPLHTDYPEFDQRQGAGTGKSWTFTFTEKGSWGFHNHLESADGGAIKVE